MRPAQNSGLAALALLLAGCAHLPGLGPSPEYPRQCISHCGAQLFAPPGVYGGSCLDFDHAEARAVAAFAAIEPRLCAKLQGVIISMQPTESWPDGWGRGQVAGITRCERRSIQVGRAPWSKGAYAHELVHLLVDCPKEDLEHKDWPPSYWAAIDSANRAEVAR